MKKRGIWICVGAALLALAVLGLVLCWQNFAFIGDKLYNRSTQAIVLSADEEMNIEQLKKLDKLQLLDARAAELDASSYDALRQALPECKILWHVPFQDGKYSPDTTQLQVNKLSLEDVAYLDYLPMLESIDATGCTDYENILALAARRPFCRITYSVVLGENIYAPDATAVKVGNGTAAQLENAITGLPKLKSVDASGCTEYAALLALEQKYPEIDFTYQVNLCGVLWDTKAKELTINNADAAQLLERLCYFRQLESVTLVGNIPEFAQLAPLHTTYPQVKFNYTSNLAGKSFATDITKLDLSGATLGSISAVENILPCFPNLKDIVLHNCDLKDEDIDAFRLRYPQLHVVWTVSIGQIRLSTDAEYFMPWQYRYDVTNEDCLNLKYCRELRCIDLGHMPVTEVPALQYATKMEFLLLAATDISDISFVKNMPDLKYCEVFVTKVTDISPLLECKKLEDLNVSHLPLQDVTVLYQMKQLKHLWYKTAAVMPYDDELKAALPDTYVELNGGSATDSGWRELENYYVMRDLINMPYYLG